MLYHKFQGEQELFSQCKSIILDGITISNPSSEQIASAGWTQYTPPTPPAVPQTEPSETDLVSAIKRMLNDSGATGELTDEEALAVAAVFPTWASFIGKEVRAGARLWYDGDLFRVEQTHTAASEWNPRDTPALFTEVSIEEFPEWHQPTGAQDAYAKGDKTAHNGKHWISDVDGNVWEPGVYGWAEI